MALNTEFLVKMPIGQKLLILVAIIAVLVLGYWLLIDSKLTDEYMTHKNTLNDKKSDLSQLETVEKDKEKLDRELKEKERKLEKAKEKLPTETEMERLLLDISERGEQNGLQFSTFTPMAEKKGNLYTEVPIELKFSGSYVYVVNFFYEVSVLPRIVNFSGVTISGGGKSKSGGSDISVSCTATTYKFAGK